MLGALLGAELAALEGGWMALREGLPTRAFDPALRAVMLTNALLFAGLGGLLGLFLPGGWGVKLSLLAVGGTAWILDHHLGLLGTLVGVVVVAALCLWFLKLGTLGRGLCLLADGAVALAIWATPLDAAKLPGIAEFLGAESQLAAGSAAPSEAELANLPGQRLPNIVWVTIDTLRGDRLGAYGYAPEGEPPISPHFDRLAGAGARFDAAYVQAPWTRPSVASMFTGLFPASHDVITQYDRMGTDLPTLAGMLRERGYRTACFSANPQVSPAFGFHRGFDQFWNSYSSLAETTAVWALRHQLAAWAFAAVPGLLGQVREAQHGIPRTDAANVNLAIFDWLDRDAIAGGAEEDPLFLYVQYLDPHDPYHAPDTPPEVEKLDESFLHAPQSLPPYPLEGSSLPPVAPTVLEALRLAYDREIRFVDRHMDLMLADLRARGLYTEGDYLIVTSDHGEEFYDHQQWLHGRSLYEEMVRVPLIVLGPGIEAGTEIDTPVNLVDLLPTLAGMTGREAPFPHQGEDLFPLLTGRGTGHSGLAYSHRPNELHPLWMLRKGQRKLIRIGDGEDAMLLAFDLASDPAERQALPEAGGEAWEDLRTILEEARGIEAALKRSGSTRVELSGAVEAGLDGLGYVDGAEPPADGR
jgi:arylsulfatase A-like enzyme